MEYQWPQDAFGQVDAWLRALGLQIGDYRHSEHKGMQ